jgi:DNA polymerase-1
MTQEIKIQIAKWLLDPDGDRVSSGDLGELEEELKKNNLYKIYVEIELPLYDVLEKMSDVGILVDKQSLAEIKIYLDKELVELVKKIYELSGKEFNLNSPKQLGEILFDVLKIKSKKKTKGGGRSTGAESLEEMRGEHVVVDSILKYRELFKLQSTYVLPILEIATTSKDSRVHTTFLQTHTATGRLSSENPNLQNIPTGTDLAKKLRACFIASEGHSLLSLDYSQIELRVLAHVAQDYKMIEAFRDDLDIHKLTASNVLNKPLGEVTKEERQLAKTLNFGVIYGMGAQAFARSSGLSYAEAEKFIAEYFNDFKEIKVWHEKIIREAMRLGYVENLNGRKRWLPNMISDNFRSVSEAHRAAINMPIQSLAADIIKLAMLAVARELPNAPLILSIHDELVFEVSDVMLKEVADKIKKIMEGVYKLSVPLKVDVAWGKNWAEIS